MRKTPDSRHVDGGRYGNWIFHCILGVKERALFHLAQTEPAEVSFRSVLRSKTNSSPNGVRLVRQMLRLILYPFNLLSSTRLLEATLFRVFLVAVGQYTTAVLLCRLIPLSVRISTHSSCLISASTVIGVSHSPLAVITYSVPACV
ncbi:hypothetical protein AVEN_250944-1 [Araneus ventricosus]|uniref:Uncharacterized protein n=1 Tax=Araneus ventricosus TaxID=182803 RepID=A0A4Y2PXC0_ARAVE|nr:hypothetical protein AVEN_157286-1 [Araneus ventricosus]GBN54907.1 hypothetical protein AVEN_250944-1 [Araneus ventricosus]